MNRRALFFALPLGLVACAGEAMERPPRPRRFSGTWDFHFETSAFVTEAGEGPYWLAADGETWGALTAPFTEVGSPWGELEIEVEGLLSPPGQYGHLAAYERELRVTRVISSRLRAPR